MELQTVFYTIGTIYMLVNLVIIVGIAIGVYFIVKTVVDVRKKTMEKVKYIENALNHPDEIIADIGAFMIKAIILRGKRVFRRKG